MTTDEEEPPCSEKGVESRPTRHPKFSLGVVMVFVFMAATVAALYARIDVVEEEEPDVAPVVALLTVLTGVAIGAWRRASATATMIQIALTCVAIIGFWQAVDSESRLANYFLVALMALTVVVPLLIRRITEEEGATGSGRGRRRWVASGAVLGNVGLHFAVLAALCVAAEVFFINNVNSFIYVRSPSPGFPARSITVPINPPAPKTDVAPVIVAPGSTSPAPADAGAGSSTDRPGTEAPTPPPP